MISRKRSEFCRLVDVARLERHGRSFSIEATAEERSALARRFDVVSVEALAASGTVSSSADRSTIRLDAHLMAEVVQVCVVSLRPVAQSIDVGFTRVYSTDVKDEWESVDNDGHEIFLSPDTDDLPEPVIDGNIDLGEAVAEQLALEMDPFPRAPEADISELGFTGGQTDRDGDFTNPFSRLAAVKANLKKGES